MVNVAAHLGLEHDGKLLEQARRRWREWTQADPRLGVVEKFDDLRDWLDSVSREEADEVLLALAMLAAPDGADDSAAAAALAKCLLPGAARVAGYISRMLADSPARSFMRDLQPVEAVSSGELINQVVAAELWIQVRSFPWRRLTKVAANIITETRLGALRELGQVTDRHDRTWALTHPAEVLARGDFGGMDRPFTPDYRSAIAELAGCKHPALLISQPEQERSADVELLEILEWALAREVISGADRRLLLCLVEEAEQISDQLIDRGDFGGLLATRLSQRVGDRVGRAEATVRRNTVRSVRALAAAVAADPELIGR